MTLYESEDECEVNNKKTSLSTARHINIDQTKVAIVTPLEDKKGRVERTLSISESSDEFIDEDHLYNPMEDPLQSITNHTQVLHQTLSKDKKMSTSFDTDSNEYIIVDHLPPNKKKYFK